MRYGRLFQACGLGLPAGVLRLVVLCEFLAGVITLIQIAILTMGLLQYCLNLSVMPPNDYADADKGYQT